MRRPRAAGGVGSKRAPHGFNGGFEGPGIAFVFMADAPNPSHACVGTDRACSIKSRLWSTTELVGADRGADPRLAALTTMDDLTKNAIKTSQSTTVI